MISDLEARYESADQLTQEINIVPMPLLARSEVRVFAAKHTIIPAHCVCNELSAIASRCRSQCSTNDTEYQEPIHRAMDRPGVLKVGCLSRWRLEPRGIGGGESSHLYQYASRKASVR